MDQHRPSLRVTLVQAVSTPLGFFVLSLLVIEASLSVAATLSQGIDRTILIVSTVLLIGTLVLIVGWLAYARPDVVGIKSKVQKIRLRFEGLVDIHIFNKCMATCTFIDSSANDRSDTDKEGTAFEQRIIDGGDEGLFVNMRVPRDVDYVYITIEARGRIFSGSLPLHSRELLLIQES